MRHAPAHSIGGKLWLEVVFPTAMVTLAAVAFVLAALSKRPGRVVMALLCVSLAGVPICYALISRPSITQRAADACRPLPPEAER